ncbi:MAG: 4Fe-4S binding protein [Coriobacteriia bacterium]|nr:4Fe-4S binding protein [Coriobacteriia bacterium]
MSSVFAPMGVQDLVLNPSRCLNQRRADSSCRYCQHVCPNGAIRFVGQDVVLQRSKCIGCGVCIAACPMEAFSSRSWSEHELVEAVRKRSGISVEITCPRFEAEYGPLPGAERTTVCLRAYSPGALFEAALNYSVILRVDACKICDCVKGRSLLKTNVRLADTWIEALTSRRGRISCSEGTAADSLNVGGSDSAQEPPVDLRAHGRDFRVGFARQGSLLFSAFREVERRSHTANRSVRQRLTAQHVPKWKQRLRTTWLGDRRTAGVSTVWPALKVNTSACLACGVCRQFCPTGAIEQRIEDGEFKTFYTPGLCADCGLCAMSCTGQAIVREYGITADPFEERAILSEPAIVCERCGAPTFARDGSLCHWCASEPRIGELMESVKQIMRESKEKKSCER